MRTAALRLCGGDGPRDLGPEVVVLLASSAQSGVLQDTPQHVAAVQQTVQRPEVENQPQVESR